MIDLREKDRAAILRIARKTLGPDAKLLVYGSRVKGGAHEASDLDLVVETPSENPLSPEQCTAFKEALQDSTIPILVQVFDWHSLPERFQENIAAHHFVLWP